MTNERSSSYQSLEAAVYQHGNVRTGLNQHGLFPMVCVLRVYQFEHCLITELTTSGV